VRSPANRSDPPSIGSWPPGSIHSQAAAESGDAMKPPTDGADCPCRRPRAGGTARHRGRDRPKMGGRVFRTRSSEELPGITTIAEWAMASGLGRVTGGQVRYGRPDPQLRLSDEREEAREPTAELSNSRSETHPEFDPHDATRCHSMLLAGRAILDFDLHEWLFLLVTVEENTTPICRCKRHALPLRHTPINCRLRRSTLVLGVSRRPV
jgi:hypothetical protein